MAATRGPSVARELDQESITCFADGDGFGTARPHISLARECGRYRAAPSLIPFRGGAFSYARAPSTTSALLWRSDFSPVATIASASSPAPAYFFSRLRTGE